MVNKIAYNCFPDRDEFVDFYINQKLSQRDLCKIYECSFRRIKKWILHFGLQLKPKGGGNNKKFDIPYEEIKNLVDSGKTRKFIAKYYNTSLSNTNRVLKEYNIRINYNTTEYQKYCREVRKSSELTYNKYKEIINPNDFPRALC